LGQKSGSRVAALELNGVDLMARLTQKKKQEEQKGELGSGKPYDGCSEVEVTLDIPVVSWEWRRDEGVQEERIRTEE
jgi:hypothetical protein